MNGGGVLIDILKRIKFLQEERHWLDSQLAEKANIPQTTISSLYTRQMVPSFQTLSKICNAFDITISQFFSDNSNLIEITPKQKVLLDNFNTLNIEQKDALLKFLETL